MSSAAGKVRVRLAGATDVGLVREHNEDSFSVVELASGVTELSALREYELREPGTLLLVCDGMGGAAAGEVASAMAVQGMTETLLAAFGQERKGASSVTQPTPEPEEEAAAGEEAAAAEASAEPAAEAAAPAVEPGGGPAAAGAAEASAEAAATAEATAVEPAAAVEPVAEPAAEPAAAEPAAPGPAAAPANDEAEVFSLARRLREAVYSVNLEIFRAACADMTKAGMGTTLTGLLLQPQRVVVAQVGDSRAYLWRQGRLVQITHDQSLVNQLLDSGQITPDQAKLFEHSNVILQALGVQEDVEVLVSTEQLRRKDRILLCSDGLVGVVSDEEIAEVMGLSESLDDTVRTLIDLARSAGGPDNITVIVAEVDGEGLAAPAPEDMAAYRPLALDPPAYPAVRYEGMDEPGAGAGAAGGGESGPLSLAAVLSMAWVIGLLLAGVVVSFLLYPRKVPGHLPPRGGSCYFVAERPGLDILIDEEPRGVTNLPGVEVRMAPGEHWVVLRDRSGPVPLLGERQFIKVSPGQRCALRLRAPRPPVAPFPAMPEDEEPEAP